MRRSGWPSAAVARPSRPPVVRARAVYRVSGMAADAIACRPMPTVRALQVQALDGPGSIALVDVPEPGNVHPLLGEPGVVIDVHAAGVAFPDVLLTRGEYQMKQEPPFILGAEVAGVVREAPEGSGVRPGERVAAMTLTAAFAEVAVAPAWMTWHLREALDFAAARGGVGGGPPAPRCPPGGAALF